jgi:hypothetical protein
MNTHDPRFFPQAVSEIDQKLMKTRLKSEDIVKVDLAVYTILQDYLKSHNIKRSKRTLNLAKPITKKRKRAENRAAFELSAAFGVGEGQTKRVH